MGKTKTLALKEETHKMWSYLKTRWGFSSFDEMLDEISAFVGSGIQDWE